MGRETPAEPALCICCRVNYGTRGYGYPMLPFDLVKKIEAKKLLACLCGSCYNDLNLQVMPSDDQVYVIRYFFEALTDRKGQKDENPYP